MPRHTAESLMLLRKRMGLDQDEFGRLIGVTRAYVSRLENGHFEISANIAERLSALSAHKSDNATYAQTLPTEEDTPGRAHAVNEPQSHYGHGITIKAAYSTRPAEPTRAQIEARVKAFLDAAEKLPGGLGFALNQVKIHLNAATLEALHDAD